jgi:GNAT superfamily N-acetyltransferase
MVTIDQPDVDAFVDLAWRLHHADPAWIPPMRARVRDELTAADAFGANGCVQLFGCQSGGRLVGRIAAIVNGGITNVAGDVVGQVGYFEAVDDDQVAANLFDAAFEWLRARGVRRVWGPMNGGAHRSHRLMTAGFDRTPFLFEPRNPEYYPRLFERVGFRPCYTWCSIDVTAAQVRHALATLPMFRINDSVKARYDVASPQRLDPGEVLQRLYPLLDRMWTGHIGYVPLDFAEFAAIFGPALSLMSRLDFLWVVERGSHRDVGCGFAYPDHADDVRALNGDPGGWGRWRAAGAAPKRLVLHTVALSPDARGHGLATWLVQRMLQHCADDYSEGVMALIIEEFTAVRQVAPPTRHYALFEHSFG